MTNDLVSVIIPFYKTNAAAFNECIKSVTDQSYRNIEIIVIDDGSGTESDALLNDICSKDRRIVLNRQERNKGLSSARNIGIQLSNGEYIVFIDSDDTLNSKAIEYMMQVKTNSGAQIVIGGLKIVGEYGHDKDNIGALDYELFSTREGLRRMVSNYGFGSTACGRLMDKSLWREVHFIEGILHEDMATMWEVFEESAQIAWIKNDLYYYFQGGESAIHKETVSEKFINDFIFALNRRNHGIEKKFGNLDWSLAFSYLMNCPNIYMYCSKMNPSSEAGKYKKILKNLFDENYHNGLRFKNIQIKKRIKIYLFKIAPEMYCKLYESKRRILGLRN